MAGLLIRLVFESLVAGAFITAGILIISFGTDIPAALGWALVIVGGLVFVHVIAAAAFGKVKTPADMGVGFRVPGTMTRRTADVD